MRCYALPSIAIHCYALLHAHKCCWTLEYTTGRCLHTTSRLDALLCAVIHCQTLRDASISSYTLLCAAILCFALLFAAMRCLLYAASQVSVRRRYTLLYGARRCYALPTLLAPAQNIYFLRLKRFILQVSKFHECGCSDGASAIGSRVLVTRGILLMDF